MRPGGCSASWLVLAAFALWGCGEPMEPEPPLEPTYANVHAVVERTCTFSTCHGGPGRGESRLNFQRLLDEGKPLTEALIGVPSCQYDVMPLVDPGNPDNSWLMIKLDGPHDDAGNLTFTPDPGWVHGLEPNGAGELPRSECPYTVDGAISFGLLMPRNLVEPLPLEEREVEMIRAWIAAGAPGP